MRALWATRRRLVFTYDVTALMLLLIGGLLYLKYRDASIIDGWPPKEYRVFAHCMWLGALGGVIISLKGVYDNACDPPWSNCYNLWHLGRPFSGAVTGLITVLIFMVVSQGSTGSTGFSRPMVYLAAFILGTQEARFFQFLFEIGRIIVQVPPTFKGAGGLRVTAIEPAEGRAGAVLILAGQGFERGASVKLGGVALANAVIAPEGSSVGGSVPDLGGVTRSVDVTVLNPSGSSAVLPDKFKFIASLA